MNKKKKILFIVISIGVLLLIIFNLNIFEKGKQVNIFILDKSVSAKHKGDHHAIQWILNYTNIRKKSGEKYNLTEDYYGFIPKKPYNEKNYVIKSVNIRDIESITQAYDLFCFVDAHGVFFGDWFNVDVGKKSTSLIYGGLNQNDYLLLRNVIQNEKKIYIEYNIKNYPTNPLISYKFEELLGIKSKGWQCKYFNDLEIANEKSLVPEWIINLYQIKSQEPWLFKGSGYILFNGFEEVIILNSSYLLSNHNYRVISPENKNTLSFLPDTIECNYDFEIIDSTSLQSISYLSLPLNDKGTKKLSTLGIENKIPFLLKNTHSELYYCAADISNYSPPQYWNYVKHGLCCQKLFSNKNIEKKFFSEYYFPLVSYLINE